VLDDRYHVRLSDEILAKFEGISVEGATGKTYRPEQLDTLADETICFCQSKSAAVLDDVLRRPVSNAAVLVTDQVRGEIDPLLLAEFSDRNIVVFCKSSPKVVFGLLLEIEGPKDKGQLLLISATQMVSSDAKFRAADSAQISESARIGDGSILASNVVIGDHVQMGRDCVVAEGASIYHGVSLGDDVHVGPGSLIGSPVHANEQVSGTRLFADIPQIGALAIGNDVRIGAQSVINRGTLSDTVLGDQIRIGDRVNIGHNVQIGNRVWIAASSIVCGSSQVGNDVSIGIGAVIKNKMKIGDGAMVGAGSVIMSNVEAQDKTYPVPALSEKALLKLMRLIRKSIKRS